MCSLDSKFYVSCIRGFFTNKAALRAVAAVRSFVNWYIIISLPVQSEASLEHAGKFLGDFNEYKEEFQSIGCSVNIPKIHAMQHYDQRVRDFGSPGNFDTEYTEHQHILDAKDPYRASNKRDPVPQMLRFVHRRTATEMKYQYLETIGLNSAKPGHPLSLCKHSLGSRVENCPIPIFSASMKYEMKDLEVDIRTFLHNQTFPPEEG
jgi:hypothetical protein